MTDTKQSKYEGLTPGTYLASIVDWGIREADIGGRKQLLAWIAFDFSNEGKVHRIHWEGFLLKKDGDVNQKTMNSINACGFYGADMTSFMSETALNTAKKVNVTIEIDDKGYYKVEWINNPDESPRGKGDDVKSLAGYDLSRVNAALAAANMGKKAPAAGEKKSEFEKGLGF